MSDMDLVLARLERLEAENAALRAEVAQMRVAPATTAGTPDDPVSRRQLLRRAGAGAGTLALSAVAASAVTLGGDRSARAGSSLAGTSAEFATPGVKGTHTTGGDAVNGESTSGEGYGVYGLGAGSGVGGYGTTGSTAGVDGYNYGSGPGVRGRSESGPGVLGLGIGGPAIKGSKHNDGTCITGEIDKTDSPFAAILGYTNGTGPGVQGVSDDGPGVRAQSDRSLGVDASGVRGGRFGGTKAQLKLSPSTAANHPPSGQRGDLFVDKPGRLWFCKGGSSWKQLA